MHAYIYCLQFSTPKKRLRACLVVRVRRKMLLLPLAFWITKHQIEIMNFSLFLDPLFFLFLSCAKPECFKQPKMDSIKKEKENCGTRSGKKKKKTNPPKYRTESMIYADDVRSIWKREITMTSLFHINIRRAIGQNPIDREKIIKCSIYRTGGAFVSFVSCLLPFPSLASDRLPIGRPSVAFIMDGKTHNTLTRVIII